eukprot:854190-Rhodomonas_salina.1
MGRPAGSRVHKAFCVTFAEAITVVSDAYDTVARSGPHCLYKVFAKACPRTTRAQTRSGLTHLEFNKVLKKQGWIRVKFHASIRQIREGYMRETTFYEFGYRRWRNPDDADDMEVLRKVSFAVSLRERLALCDVEMCCAATRSGRA